MSGFSPLPTVAYFLIVHSVCIILMTISGHLGVAEFQQLVASSCSTPCWPNLVFNRASVWDNDGYECPLYYI